MNIRLILLTAVLTSLVGCKPSPRWQSFQPPDKAYTVDMPGPPRCDFLQGPYKGVQRCAFLISKMQFTVLAWSGTVDDAAFTRMAKEVLGTEFRMADEKTTEWNGLPTLEASLTGPGPDFGFAKATHKGKDNFAVVALAMQEQTAEAGRARLAEHHAWVDRFFNSFAANR